MQDKIMDAVLDAALIVDGLLAIASAIGAAYRVRDKRAARKIAPSELPVPLSEPVQNIDRVPVTASVLDAELSKASRSITQPDRDLEQPSVSHTQAAETPPAATVSPVLLEPIAEVPLAVSLPVSELVQPHNAEVEPDLTFVDQSGAASIATSEAHSEENHHRHEVLEEIAELGQSESSGIDRLTQYVYHSDSVVRAAVAFALGEIAMKRQGQDRETSISLLSELSQDENPQVRLQAASALGTIHP